MNITVILAALVVVAILLSQKMQLILTRIEAGRKEIGQLREAISQLKKQMAATTDEQPETADKETVENILVQPSADKHEETVYETEVYSQTEIITSTITNTADCKTEENRPAATVVPSVAPSSPVLPKPVYTPKRQINYEKLIGENLFGKIGILILVAGIGLFVKYAIDNEWIDETFRTILGFLAGSGLLFIAERLHKNYRTFSSLLAGGAFAIFYTITAVAYHYYGLFSQPVAFILLCATTLFMSVLALLYNRRELAAIAITGGFLAPFLVSSGQGSYILLFTYILILNTGMFILSWHKKWGELPLISFFFTWLCVLLSVWQFESASISSSRLFFASCFYLLFMLPLAHILKGGVQKRLNRVLTGTITLNNFIYLAFGLYDLHFISQLKINGLFALFIAMINLFIAMWLKKQAGNHKTLLSIFLAIVITFVSLAIPLQLNGNFITIFWASELVILLWLSIRTSFRLYEYFSYVVALLTLISWGMDISYPPYGAIPSMVFINGYFIASLYTAAAFLIYAWLLKKYNMPDEKERKFYTPINVISIGIGCILLWSAIHQEWAVHIDSAILSSLCQNISTAIYLFALSLLLKKRFPTQQYVIGYLIGAGLNILFYLATFLFHAGEWENGNYGLLAWVYWIIIVLHVYSTSKIFYTLFSFGEKKTYAFTISLNTIVSVLSLIATWQILHQTGAGNEFNAGFSICLAIIGFIQMIIGMKLHFKLFRYISLCTFGIILLKLLLIDIWLLPTIGKIMVFVLLGMILLLLSFMYHKRKNNDR